MVLTELIVFYSFLDASEPKKEHISFHHLRMTIATRLLNRGSGITYV